jgi:DNA polymerase-3 subunit delta
MELDALDKALAAGPSKPVWLIQGDELWTVEEATRRVLRASVADAQDAMAVTRIDLAEGKRGAREIVAACRAIGLFTARVAVVVRAAELLDKRGEDREELLRYCQGPAREATLILKASGTLDGRTSFMKGLKKHGEVLTYDPLKAPQAISWFARRLTALGHRHEADVPRLAVELSGPNLLQLQQIADQLSLYAGPGNLVRVADVEVLLASTREHTVFELIDAVTASDTRGLLRHLHAMLEQRERPLGILTMVTRHFRMLTEASDVVQRGGRAGDVQAKLKCHPFVAEKLVRQVERFSTELLRRGFERFAAADLQLKTARVDPNVRVEQLLVDLAEAARAGSRGGRPARP